jgi:hypothetical protein
VQLCRQQNCEVTLEQKENTIWPGRYIVAIENSATLMATVKD